MFGTNACGASVKDWVQMFKARDSSDVLVSVEKIVVTGVTEAVVPEKTLSGLCERKHREIPVRWKEVVVEVRYRGRELDGKESRAPRSRREHYSLGF